MQGINSYYNQALKRELVKSLPLATGPGPGVIVVRAAITAVSSKTESLKPYEYIPVALVAAAVSTGPGFVIRKRPWVPRRSSLMVTVAR